MDIKQVTAIYQGSEIAYGEGEGLDYAIADCVAAISPMYEGETVTLSILENGEIRQLSGEVYLTMNGDTALDI
jgi:hypothetical protein